MTSGRKVEFWPDNGGALLFDDGGQVPLGRLPISPELAMRAQVWVAGYDETKLPWEGGDREWLAEGRAVFDVLRDTLAAHAIELTDWEGLWDSSSPKFETLRSRWPQLLTEGPDTSSARP